jgi:xylan 1,4-beta-xylosidase
MKIFYYVPLLIFPVVLLAQPRTIQINPSVEYNVTQNDISHLRRLAGGVGWEFEPNVKTDEGLKKIGIRKIRCINVDPLLGTFDAKEEFHIAPPGNQHLQNHFTSCRAIGAVPHIIIANYLHPDLVLKEKDLTTKDPTIMGMVHNVAFGPTNWKKFRNYYKAYFKFVLIDEKFPEACFEIGNEADVSAGAVEKPPKAAWGSRRLYEHYFKVFRNIAQAAGEFEAENPGTRVRLGGPALTTFTFAFGDFNWMERFLRDVRLSKVKLDYFSFHFYGNISPLAGEGGIYPSFEGILSKIRQWRDKYTPEVPIWITEWGATYHTSMDPQSLHNGNNVGASWSAAFLNQMLIEGVDRGMYLVTTDLRQPINGKDTAIWGWPSLFTNNQVYGTHPKAPYHVFTMLSKMAPKRIEAMNPGGTLGCIASRDDRGRLTVLLWNNSYRITEFGPGTELGQEEAICLRVVGGEKFFKGPVRINRYLVSKNLSNAWYLFEKGEKLDDRAELQKVESCTTRPVDNMLNFGFVQPASSVSFIEMEKP